MCNRHGWGCEPDPPRAITYLSLAAQNSAAIEDLALQAGMKKGGAAKGELVLAIFELANCFRYGWGVQKDPLAAKQYYETAANLGDTDAMNEAAWCYLEGFGTKKDKVRDENLFFGEAVEVQQGSVWVTRDFLHRGRRVGQHLKQLRLMHEFLHANFNHDSRQG